MRAQSLQAVRSAATRRAAAVASLATGVVAMMLVALGSGPAHAADPNRALSGVWVAATLFDTEINTRSTAAPRIVFRDDRAVSGVGACHRFLGRHRIALRGGEARNLIGKGLTILVTARAPLEMRAECDDEARAQDAALQAALTQSRSVIWLEDVLLLFDQNGRMIASFEESAQ